MKNLRNCSAIRGREGYALSKGRCPRGVGWPRNSIQSLSLGRREIILRPTPSAGRDERGRPARSRPAGEMHSI
jgi:hypothetical protein